MRGVMFMMLKKSNRISTIVWLTFVLITTFFLIFLITVILEDRIEKEKTIYTSTYEKTNGTISIKIPKEKGKIGNTYYYLYLDGLHESGHIIKPDELYESGRIIKSEESELFKYEYTIQLSETESISTIEDITIVVEPLKEITSQSISIQAEVSEKLMKKFWGRECRFTDLLDSQGIALNINPQAEKIRIDTRILNPSDITIEQIKEDINKEIILVVAWDRGIEMVKIVPTINVANGTIDL